MRTGAFIQAFTAAREPEAFAFHDGVHRRRGAWIAVCTGHPVAIEEQEEGGHRVGAYRVGGAVI